MSLWINLFYDEKVITWSKHLLGLLGLWPESQNDLRLFFYVTYVCLFTWLELVTFMQNLKDIETTIRNITLSLPTVLIVFKVIMFRLDMHRVLPMLKAVKENVLQGLHRTDEEREKVVWYNVASTLFTVSSVVSLFFVPLLFYTKPIVDCVIARFNDCSLPYDLPLKVNRIYEVREARDYALFCACLMPVSALLTVGATGADSLLVSLTFYLCGQLSILGNRLRHVDLQPRRYHYEMKALVHRHAELLRLAAILEDTFSSLMFVQILGVIFALCVIGYQFLLMAASGEEMNAVHFVLYSCAVVLLAFCYCFLGECLIAENSTLDLACYYIDWYELPAEYARPIIICIARARKPLCLTAGKFYVFSLETFGGIIKSSMAYLSVLRTIV